MIKEFEYVSFTTDAWSGPGDSYLSLTITGISKEWKRVSLPLAVSHFPGSHTSVAIDKKIHDLLDSFQIEPDKCHVFLRDGGANIKKCFQTNEFFHADCGSHLLNLVVRDSLKPEPISELLKKCRAIVGHFKHSNAAMDHFKDLQIESDLPSHMLLQDMPVRWNCAYYMADRLLEQKFAVQHYAVSKQRLDMSLSDNDWEKLSQLRNLLSYAEELSKLFCDNPISVQCGFASLTISGIEKLNFSDRDVLLKYDLILQRLNFRIHGVAHFLDPRFKDMKSGSSQDVFRKQIFEWLKEEWLKSGMVEIVHSPVTKRPNYGLLADFDDEMGCEINVPSTSACDPTSDLWKEIVDYASKPRQTLQMQDPSDANKSKACDPMDWWKNNTKDYPLLSKFAKRYLTPDCTTRMSEGLFSTARNVFTYQRMRLKPRKAQMIIFLNRILPVINYRY
ncbi:zinc finger BED domain-containing protein 4 [Ditylenchus destructor]|uniref:Zinc finger BED domain-containing protein 4 n=1 Tax=Ditylenchus destructor TaxID=166010 RepID=A0AAD4MRC3_9BILA|nr:zinc finger BED domain-containing protein 4 [Ditylenchus destructor]